MNHESHVSSEYRQYYGAPSYSHCAAIEDHIQYINVYVKI